MKSPALTTQDGTKNITLYMSTVKSIEAATKLNLKKTLEELGIQDGQEIVVADVTSPQPLSFVINYSKHGSNE